MVASWQLDRCKAAKELQATVKQQQRDIRCLQAMAGDANDKQQLQV